MAEASARAAKAARVVSAAKAAAAAPGRESQPGGGAAARRWRSVAALAGIILLLLLSTPTFLVMFIGMMPSIVALIVDRTPYRHAATAVASLNAAGVMPFVFEMWFEAHSIAGAQALLTNPFALLAMYGAAASGWLLFAAIPMVYIAIHQTLTARQIQALRKHQEALLAEWGDEVKVQVTAAARAAQGPAQSP